MDALHEIDDDILKPPWGRLGRSATFGLVAGFAKLVLNVCNSTKVVQHETLLQAVLHREKGRGLVTISNHTSMFDDPGLVSASVPWSYFWTDPWHDGMRWSLCAAEVCFKNAFLRQFFLNGKTLPVQRGAGVDQPILRLTAGVVGAGGWAHVFPEGKINYSGLLGPFRWGVGKLVCDARNAAGGRDPLILPFYHSGMANVLPPGANIPRVGNNININVGQLMDLSPITCNCDSPDPLVRQAAWRDITLAMHQALRALEAVSPPNPDQQELVASILAAKEKQQQTKQLKANGTAASSGSRLQGGREDSSSSSSSSEGGSGSTAEGIRSHANLVNNTSRGDSHHNVSGGGGSDIRSASDPGIAQAAAGTSSERGEVDIPIRSGPAGNGSHGQSSSAIASSGGKVSGGSTGTPV